MKAIFSNKSKTANKKEISGNMDRHRNTSVIGKGPNANNQAIVSPSNGRVSSFIPTPATYHGHMNGHAGKQIQNSVPPQLPNGVMQHPTNPNHFYSNIPGNPANVPRQEHHYTTNYQQQSIQSQQQIHQRTLTKSYSSSHNQNYNQQSHYGNTSLYASNNNANHNHSAFYGNTANIMNGAMIMNGHHAGEKNLMNGHHVSEVIGQAQNSYNHEQSNHHQTLMQTQVLHKVHPVQNQGPTNQRVHHPQNFQQLNAHMGANATDGLPHGLVESMRTLFDILDDSKLGKIRLSDIETRWESDSNNGSKTSGAEPLIKMGVLEYLRKVTPADGLLTFDRFCSGLRLALLTNSGEPSEEKMQSEKMHRSHNPPPPPPPQQYFQEQVRNMSNSKPMHNLPPPQPVYNGNANNIATNNNKQPPPPTGQSNTIHRFSKIPNFSTSRLPQPSGSGGGGSSGIPLSPTNRANTIPMANNKSQPSHPHPHQHNNTSLIGGTKRYPTNSEQGTTVALVHPQPPNPNPKPIVGGTLNYNSYSTMNGGGTIRGDNKPIGSGFLNRFSSRNSSMDDLKGTNESHVQVNSSAVPNKDRPPSAPILDSDENTKTHDSHPVSNQNKNRERAKSQERDRAMNSSNNGHLSRAEEKSNFVKSRQRTLSMPQLQLNKLKPKSSVNFDESSTSTEKIAAPPTENNYPKPSALKNNSSHPFSKLLSGGHQYGSAIPTFGSANNTLKHSKTEDPNNSKNDKEANDQTPPPPKPPRNAITISTTLINDLTQDPPLSGSSFGSGQTQSSATLSASASNSSGGNSAKPEIRSVLSSWQKNMVDKEPVKPTLGGASLGTVNSSLINTTNETTKKAPLVKIGATGAINSSDDVKLRQPTKSSLKRKETAHRRHTVQSGIDFSALKRLKQLEQERDILQQGLQYLEKANEWYLKQLETSSEKINLLSKGAPTSDYWSESHEERLNLLGCRITEVNSKIEILTDLMDGSSQLPLHMNLQIPSHLSLKTITRLKDQNRQLTQEVSDYSHRVTQLENEKAMLLRQLFHQKNQNSNSDETVYM